MRHRDLQSLREFREEEERIERERRERRERKEAAEKARRQKERELDRQSVAREFDRECALNGQDSHFLINIPEEMIAIKMPVEEATKYNSEQAQKFALECKEYAAFKSEATFRAMADYMEKNGARIVSAQMLKVAFERLRDLSIIHPNHEPKKPAPALKNINLTIERPKFGDRVNGGVLGRDPDTGGEKIYSELAIARMPADLYRKCFPCANTCAELLTAMAAARGAART